jgi:GNAT superfamily N-acetyltransferase
MPDRQPGASKSPAIGRKSRPGSGTTEPKPAPTERRAVSKMAFHTLTPDRWNDLESLFGPRGACGGCWCMAWRLTPSDFSRLKGDGTRRALRAIVTSGEPTGILAYDGEAPIGWCAVAPREATPRLGRARVLGRIDDVPVWSVTCFFVARAWRKQGVTVALLRAAAAHARRQGALILEGYPVEPRTGEQPAAFVWTGLASAFRAAGFSEVARRSATRPIFRLALRKGTARSAAASAAARSGRRS